jgi:hypothetical protein
MATVHVDSDRIRIHLSFLEKLAGLHGDLTVPRSSVRTVEVVADGPAAAHGLRAPGLAIPGRVKMGTWRGRQGRRRYISVRRDVPALALTLDGHRYETVLVSAPEAHAVASALRPA